MENAEIKEIIVVTDGKSNIGGNPGKAAKMAADSSIVVSAIGILGREDDEPLDEIQNIARNGRGEWELTYIQDLSKTLQLMTQKTVNKTISTVVNKELRELLGADLDEIKPKERGKYVRYIENLSNQISLKCCVLIDCSGSMKPKLHTAKKSIIELMNSLQGRKGKSEIAVIAFPGGVGEKTKIVTDFTDKIEDVKRLIKDIEANGTTPTAPAIYRAIDLFNGRGQEEIIEEEPAFGENIV